jgi:uncharacterized short protein YbdD (DUF466 family)
VISAFRRFWSIVRELTGDDAYERYLAHWRAHHAGDAAPLAREAAMLAREDAPLAREDAPLDRAAFFRAEQRRKWDGVRRCC